MTVEKKLMIYLALKINAEMTIWNLACHVNHFTFIMFLVWYRYTQILWLQFCPHGHANSHLVVRAFQKGSLAQTCNLLITSRFNHSNTPPITDLKLPLSLLKKLKLSLLKFLSLTFFSEKMRTLKTWISIEECKNWISEKQILQIQSLLELVVIKLVP